MSKNIKITRGYDIRLVGEPEKIINNSGQSKTYALKPTDFFGVVPKLMVKQGDEVKAGSPIFYDKKRPNIIFTSPVSGIVSEIVRGEKRKLLEIRITADSEIQYEKFEIPQKLERQQIVELLLKSGLWAFIRQRPYGIIADPDDVPRDIFISAFDTNPLGPDNDLIVHGQGELFQFGLDLIKQLTPGKLHLSIRGDEKPSGVFRNAKNVEIHTFSGPHPAGNVGVQIHHIAPICKGEVVWTLTPQDVLTIAKFFKTGTVDYTRVVAVGGSGIQSPKHFRTIAGVSMAALLENNLKNDREYRIISGSVLTGTKVDKNGYLGFYDYQVSVIPEGGQPEFLGWLLPGFNKFSLSGLFLSKLLPSRKYDLDTSMHGEERPFVVSGQYEKVFPFDIYPVQLLKAILVEDLELMEKLGIYEVVPEDFALCEVICTSKINSQEIVKKGIELAIKEL